MAEETQLAPEYDTPRANPFARLDAKAPAADALAAITPETTPETPETYVATAEDLAVASEIEQKFGEWRKDRQDHEPQWFTNASFFRGRHDVYWSQVDNRLLSASSPNPSRSRRQINRIFGKVRARRAKFLKNRPTWIIVPATSDIKDKLDARYTGKVLDYIWRKLHLETKMRDALLWSETCGRGYWWFGWNPDALGRVQLEGEPDPANPGAPVKKTIQEGVVGEVTIEVGSPFEVVVGNSRQVSMNYMDEVIRAKERTLDYVQAQFPERGHLVTADTTSADTFRYENEIAALGPSQNSISGGMGGRVLNTKSKDAQGNPNTVIVKEYFQRPNGTFPKGRYCVVAGGVLLKESQELPFGMWDMENPFPCVEFIDIPSAGQYWSTTLIEQLIDVQREYNGVRSMISTQIKLMGHPKVFVAQQHQIAEGAWTPDAGEIITYNARPGIDKPFVWEPPNIVGDAWRLVELLKSEFDDLTQIYPASEGKTSGTESGFHANLLQEATDMVHGPDVRSHEMTIEEAALKIRRIIKQGYTIPRLMTVTAGSYQPEVFEFSAEDVDEYADIVVQAGSGLPQLKGARIQAALDLFAKGVLGDPADPEVRRRLLNVLDMGGMEDLWEYAQVDEEMINIENSEAEEGGQIAQPRFFEDHTKHWAGHINKLKSPAVMNWPPEARMGLLAHAILHAKYINHAAAFQMAAEAGLDGLIPPPPPELMMGQPLPPGTVPGGPPAGAPPGATSGPSPDVSFGEAPDMTPAAGTPQAAGG